MASAKLHLKGKTYPFLERFPFTQSLGMLLEEGAIYVHYSEIRTGACIHSRSPALYWGFIVCGSTFLSFPMFFQPFSTLVFTCQGFGQRFRCLRINYFNLSSSFSLSSSHTCTQAAAHLPLLATFKEQSSTQTSSFLINFFFFALSLFHSLHLAMKVLEPSDICHNQVGMHAFFS